MHFRIYASVIYVTFRFKSPSAPSGTVSNIQVTSRTKDGGTVTWDELPCPNRGGVLIHYYLEVYRLPSMTLEDTYETNMTSFFVSSLMPFQRYGVNVTFVNSVGSSEPTELTEFVTLEDGEYVSLY